MILALDAGNSRVKWGCYENGNWVKTGVVAHGEIDHLKSILGTIPSLEKIVVSNVAGAETQNRIETAIAHFGMTAIWPKPRKSICGVINGYDEPQKLGSDRWAALIGARRESAGATLVVNAGTALTVDTLTERGEFLGGLILPGIGMMMRALSTGTAHAHADYGDFSMFPTKTRDAIYSGAVNAALGAIERMRAALSAKSTTLTCVITGGAAPALLPHLAQPAREIPHLVLLGLVTIAETRD